MSVALAVVASVPWGPLPSHRVAPRLALPIAGDEPPVPPIPPPFVSVIVPARNERDHIERCAPSILSSAYPNLEVIIVCWCAATRTTTWEAMLLFEIRWLKISPGHHRATYCRPFHPTRRPRPIARSRRGDAIVTP